MSSADRSNWEELKRLVEIGWRTVPFRGSDVGTVVGCSGGADSVALARCLSEMWRSDACESSIRTGPLILAHFNHQLRGEASESDEQFVVGLATELDLPVEVARHGDWIARASHEEGLNESAWRSMRRNWFVDVAARRGCRIIALAHTMDDQAETVLHRLFRGTGTLGLTGMSPTTSLNDVAGTNPSAKDMVIRRPMLHIRATAIRSALRQQGFVWREDASNLDRSYARNWIRWNLLPKVSERFPNATTAIARAADLHRETHAAIESVALIWLQEHATIQLNGGQRLTLCGKEAGPNPWRDAAWNQTIIVLAIQLAWDRLGWPRGEMSHAHWSSVAALVMSLQSASGPPIHCPVLPGNIRYQASPNQIRFWRSP